MAEPLLSDLKVSGIIEGIEASVTLFRRHVRVIVSADVLQTCCEAGSTPDSLLQVAAANTDLVEQAASRAFSVTRKTTLVLQKL